MSYTRGMENDRVTAPPVAAGSRWARRLVTVVLIGAALLVAGMFMLSFTSTRPTNLGVTDGRLAPPPLSPNCVSSDADGEHAIEPFAIEGDPAAAWDALCKSVAGLPRTTIVTRTDDYLHAECRSLFFRFVDDLELHLRPDDGIIAVRSASRVGRSDLGVNRKRVDRLR